MTRCVYYAARGGEAYQEARLSISTLFEHHNWPILVASDQEVAQFTTTDAIPPLGAMGAEVIPLPRPCDPGGRLAKIRLFDLIPAQFDQVLYLDADTRIRGPLHIGFELLEAGWEMVITASDNQDEMCMWHLSDLEREVTFTQVDNPMPLALQAGVFWVRRTPDTVALFQAWREEFDRWSSQDQGALLRALTLVPVRVALVGKMFNNGGKGRRVVEHQFGRLHGRRFDHPDHR